MKKKPLDQLVNEDAPLELETHGNNQRFAGATFQRQSSNDKLSHVRRKRHPNGRYQTFPQAPFASSTYVSIQATCPNTCRFKGNGCYVQAGQAANTMKRLDDAAKEMRGEDVNLLEAELIDMQWGLHYRKNNRVPQDGARGGRDLRIHVGGDFANTRGAKYVGESVERYRARGGGDAWSYTHRWRNIPSDSFGPALNVLASVETLEEAKEAVDLGYMPGITVRQFAQEKAYRVPGTPSIKIVPCPAQTRGVKCIECRLCFHPMPKGTAIAFALHGMGAARAARRLPVLGQETMSFG